jgi:hypothetical protein
MFNLEGIPGPERIALAEAIADVLLGLTTPNPGHFAPSEMTVQPESSFRSPQASRDWHSETGP